MAAAIRREREIKAKKLLKPKTYKLAAQMAPIAEDDRRKWARECLDAGATAGRAQLTALAQAKLVFAAEALQACARFRCSAFACIVARDAPVPEPMHLRKDYAYLFERFYYFLEDRDPTVCGAVVFDEIEKSRSHILIEQMDRYFRYTARGVRRAAQVIPEPFFVHSELTTGIQLADLIAYIVSWGFRLPGMDAPHRAELEDLVALVSDLRYRTARDLGGSSATPIWSFTFIQDLRPRDERQA